LSVAAVQAQEALALEGRAGIQVEFSSYPHVELAFASLGNETKRIELLSAVSDETTGVIRANVFIPDGALAHFHGYLRDYEAYRKDRNGRPLDRRALVDAILSIRISTIRALWTDAIELLPADAAEPFWWEVWVPVRKGLTRDALIHDFNQMVERCGCRLGEGRVDFPERTVVSMFGSQDQLAGCVMTLNCVAELRRLKETAEFFDAMGVVEQQEWTEELLGRLELPPDGDGVPRVCHLDTGVTRGHPLLRPLMEAADLHSVDPDWGVDDGADHGTGLAGVSAYGDLTEALSTADPIRLSHRLESVKLVPGEGQNHGDARHHGHLFIESVARPEIAAPRRMRVFTSAVTASDYRDRGRPSSWSAAVDALAANTDNDGGDPRLFVLSAGNIKNQAAWADYPACLSTNLVHDPGQSWNAITVGACTLKTDTEGHRTLKPIAATGGLSPFTTTSKTWESPWPLKPEIVLEGGNAAKDVGGAFTMSSLSLLAPHHLPLERLFTTTNATSAASALCAGMAAKIMATYPHLRPETIRALIVHSASWTDDMRRMYLPVARPANKADHVDLIRHCGWGTPDLQRALWSASDSLTLMVEDAIHPYKKGATGIETRDMNLHALPWPLEELEALGEAQVELRVTLSYFIEPNPSARGVSSKYHYPSHRLRFDVRRPLDRTTQGFVARLNAAVELDDDEIPVDPRDSEWLLGKV